MVAFSIPLSLAALSVAAFAVWHQRQAEQRQDADIARTHQVLADQATTINTQTDAIRAISKLQHIDHMRINMLAARARIDAAQQAPEPINPNDVIAAAERIIGGAS